MLRNDYDNQVCSIARALEVVGERWTLLIIRDVFLGVRRFDELQSHLGVARNVLQVRLERLVDNGVLEKTPYQERPLRHEYRLTDKGIDLWPTIVALLQWGDRHAAHPEGPPVLLTHKDCGGELDSHRVCLRCGKPVEARQARALPGPSVPADHPLHRRAQRTAAAAAS
jgi:DNA-binding HxlR family transcriptional regulator